MSSVISISVSTIKIDSFYKYALAMLKSLADNSKLDIPIIIHYDIMTEVQRNNLEKVNKNIIEFKPIPIEKYKRFNKMSGGWYVLEGWALKDYDRIIILDSDFICQGDISYLDTITDDIAMCKEGSGIFNAGLVVLSKKLILEDYYWKMLSCKPETISIGGNRDKFSKDQKLVNAWLHPRIKQIDRQYNCLVSDHFAIKCKMVHYIYKPLYEVGRNQLEKINPELIKLWEKYYKKALEIINDKR